MTQLMWLNRSSAAIAALALVLGRRRRGRMGDTWHLDELFVNIQGRRQYLWRAVDEDGDVIDQWKTANR
jgi:transposase-like protein